MKVKNWISSFPKPFVIAGPCSAESEKQMLSAAKQLDPEKISVFRAGIWKPRTKPNSFEGVGAIGLKWLEKVKEEYGFLTTTEVANASHVRAALDHNVDILWIGARTTVNPFHVQEIAEALKGTDKIVLVKNPVNPDLDLWIGALERLNGQGIEKLGAIHRGFSAYRSEKYRNPPQWQIPLDFMNRLPDIPMICDPSHITGNRGKVESICQKAMNFGFHGLMVEAHPSPEDAWSDAAQQVTPKTLNNIVESLKLRNDGGADEGFRLKLEGFRNRIDDKDQAVLELIEERMEIAHEIGKLKKEFNITVYQRERWEHCRTFFMESGESLGLSKEFTQQLARAIHQESIKVQNEEMVNKKEN